MKNRFVSILALTLMTVWYAPGQLPVKSGMLEGDSPLEISADRHEIDNESGVWVCDGNVHVANARHTLRADHVRLDSRTGEVEAKGNIELSQPGVARWVGETLTYNYKTGAGLSGASLFQAGRLTVGAERSERSSSGCTTLWDLTATTCTNAPGHRHYEISGKKVLYVEGHYLSGWGSIAWFHGLPVLYFPYWYYRTNERFGLELRPGYTSDWGPFLLSAYDFPIYASTNSNAYIDGRVRFDMRAHRGVAFGSDLSWYFGEELGKGNVSFYFAADTDGPEREPPYILPGPQIRDRSRIAVEHVAEPTERDRVVVKGQYLSDEALLKDFFRDTYRKEPQPYNLASYTRRQDEWAGGVTVSGPLNGFYDGVKRLPEGWVNIMPRKLLPGIYYESQTRVGYLEEQTKPKPFLRERETETVRLDTAHRLSAPFTVGDVLRLTPRAGYRGTFYNDSWDENDGRMRNLFELGIEASVKGYGTFGELRHIIEPYLDYSYIPRPKDLEYGETYSFDRYDMAQEWRDQFGFDGLTALRERNGFRGGLRNTLQHRDADGTRTFLESDIYAALTLDEKRDPAGLQALGLNLSLYPSKVSNISVNSLYDTREDTLRHVDARVRWRSNRWRVSSGFVYRSEPPNVVAHDPWQRLYYSWFAPDDRASVLTTEVERALNSIWSIGVNTRSDFRRGNVQEIGVFLQYKVDCMAVQLRTIYKPATNLGGWQKQDSDYRVALLVWILSNPDDDGGRTNLLGW